MDTGPGQDMRKILGKYEISSKNIFLSARGALIIISRSPLAGYYKSASSEPEMKGRGGFQVPPTVALQYMNGNTAEDWIDSLRMKYF